MITWEFLSEKASRRSKMLNAIFEMKFSFMWLHLFPWESKQNRRLIEWGCPWHTPNSKIFISFWHSLKLHTGTKGSLFLLHLIGCTYSSPLFTVCCFSCVSVTTVKLNSTSSSTHWGWPHAGRPDPDISPQLGPVNTTEMRCFAVVVSLCKWVFSLHKHVSLLASIWHASSSHHGGNGGIWIIDWNNVK